MCTTRRCPPPAPSPSPLLHPLPQLPLRHRFSTPSSLCLCLSHLVCLVCLAVSVCVTVSASPPQSLCLSVSFSLSVSVSLPLCLSPVSCVCPGLHSQAPAGQRPWRAQAPLCSELSRLAIRDPISRDRLGEAQGDMRPCPCRPRPQPPLPCASLILFFVGEGCVLRRLMQFLVWSQICRAADT